MSLAAIFAAIMFGFAVLLRWAHANFSEPFTTPTLVVLGLLGLALAIAGAGPRVNRPRKG